MSIVSKYLSHYDIEADKPIVEKISWKVEHTPREIHNICVKIRDYLIAQDMIHLAMRASQRDAFEQWLNIDEWGITPLHRKYLEILAMHDDAVWVKTLAAKLGMHEKSIEQDIEPLLLKLGKIEKTTRWRVLR
jgi:Holliday junction resolvasome RuvABC ATP-dependent DNA helicase subunit